MYIHLQFYHGSRVVIGGLTTRMRAALLLSTGKKLRVTKRGHPTVLSGLPKKSPDSLNSVIKLELDGEPDHDISRVIGYVDVFPDLPR